MKDGLTLAVMVRDDAAKLDRCLASMRPFVDQIVVLDTGSKDDSVAIAKKHGAVVHEIEWPDNFSVALNILLSKVETKWTFRLDSDEWVDPPQGKSIRELSKQDKVAAYYLIRRDLIDDAGRFDEIHVLRLWQTDKIVQYEGAVHEVIRHARFEEAFPGKVLLTSDVFFWHDGYIHQVQQKGERNLVILRREVKETPDRLESLAMLATTLHGMRDPEGMQILNRLVDKILDPSFEGQPPTQVALALAMYMELISPEDAATERIEQLIDKAVKWFHKNPVILFYAGVLERKRGDFEKALKHLLKMEALVMSGEYDRGMSIPTEFLGERLWKALGFVATQLGRQDIVQRCQRNLSQSPRR
jgi:hypothetical protein